MLLKKVLAGLFVATIFISCSQREKHHIEQLHTSKIDSITINVIKIDDGYGYEIYLHEKKLIYQPYVPTVEGNTTFRNRDQAEQAAQLVSYKIRQGHIPPTVTTEEIEAILMK